jgi:hypothetical protein
MPAFCEAKFGNTRRGIVSMSQFLRGPLTHSSVTMKRPHEPNDSYSDEEFLVAPPFATIGLSILSISWLNQQLESDGDRPGMRGEKQDSQSEQS